MICERNKLAGKDSRYGKFSTATGTELSVVVPLPKYPKKLAPQHFAVPPASSAQE